MKEQQVALAYEIASLVHDGQIRKFNGEPYITHPIWVKEAVRLQGHSELTQAAALLHDAVEDSELSISDLADFGIVDEVLVPVDLLTKDPALSYEANINRLAPHPRARVIKRFDLTHNMDITGLSEPRLKDYERLEKYGRSLVYLSRFGFPLT